MTSIKRPDLRKPDKYEVSLDETMLLLMEDGTLKKIQELEYWVGQHNGCNLDNDKGCSVRRDFLLNTYGTIEAANEQGYFQTDCSQDLAHYYQLLAQSFDFLFQARFVRNKPTSHGLHEIKDAEEKLNDIKNQVVYREAKAADDTGMVDRVVIDEPPTYTEKVIEGEIQELILSNGTGEPTGKVVSPFRDPQKGDDSNSLLGLKEDPTSSPK